MYVVICPGVHAQDLTQSFLAELQCQLEEEARRSPLALHPNLNLIILSPFSYPAAQIWQQLSDRNQPLVFIGFSAGVVGAITAAWGWQLLGGKVRAVIALDGWGVPLFGDFPIHRLSHDYFTHWSSAILGSSGDNFYAEPPVAHLSLWRSPQTAGWWVHSTKPESQPRTYTTAAQFITMLLNRYQEC